MAATCGPRWVTEQIPQPEPDGGGTRSRQNRGMDSRGRVNGLWITRAHDLPILTPCLLKISAIRCSDGLSALPRPSR
jgi:hypothetical protein